jgi:hypothetical protein
MPVSGLVVSLTQEPELRRKTVDAIRGEPRIDIGPIHSDRMALVIDTASSAEDKQLWDWLKQLPGVVFVDVALVAFEDPTEHVNRSDRLNSAPVRPSETTKRDTISLSHAKENHHGR